MSRCVHLGHMHPARTLLPQPKAGYHWLDMVGLLKAIGLFSCSVSGHSTFPSVRATLADPHRFRLVIYNSFTIMLLAYGAIAAVGYWYFGDGLHPLVINNMVNGSVYSKLRVLGSLDIGRFTSLLVGFRAYTVFPAVIVVLQVRCSIAHAFLTQMLLTGHCGNTCTSSWRHGTLYPASSSSARHSPCTLRYSATSGVHGMCLA